MNSLIKSRLGTIFFCIHTVLTVIVTILAFDSFSNGQSGEWFYVALGAIDKPFFVPGLVLFSKLFSQEYAIYGIPLVLFFAGGIQWYCIGWIIEKVSFFIKNKVNKKSTQTP